MILRAKSFEIAGRLHQLPPPPVMIQTAVPAHPRNQKPGPLAQFLTTGTGVDLATDLVRADLHIAPAEFILLNLLSGVVGFVLAFFIWHESLLLGLLGAVFGILAPRWYVRYLQNKRLTAFNKQLGDTIIILSNSLRSGYSLLQSMETVSKEMKPPVSAEFQRVNREVGLGLTLQQSLENLYRRIPSDDLDFMITAINIHREVGGNLAQILDILAHTIRERVRILGEIRAITSQQRLSAVILSLLPVALGMVLYAMNQGYVATLCQSSCGLAMLAVGGVLIVLGYFTVRQIAIIEV